MVVHICDKARLQDDKNTTFRVRLASCINKIKLFSDHLA